MIGPIIYYHSYHVRIVYAYSLGTHGFGLSGLDYAVPFSQVMLPCLSKGHSTAFHLIGSQLWRHLLWFHALVTLWSFT